MRILHIYKTYYPDTFGGVEQFIYQLSRQSATKGFHNCLLTTSKIEKPESTKVHDVEVYRYPVTYEKASCPFSWPLWQDFQKRISEADLLHYHFPWPYADLLHLFHHIKKPAVLTYHSDIVRQKVLKLFYKPVMKRFLSHMQKIVVTSENTLLSSHDLKGFEPHTQVIPLGLAYEDYPSVSQEQLLNWQKKLPPKFFLFVGVLRYYKGLHILIDALADSNIPVIIAGDGPEKDNLCKQAQKKGASGIQFLGKISDEDKVALLQLCHAVILPSHLRSEAFGLSLVEGLMMGKPLISTELGTGTSFVNQHEKTGYVVEAGSVHALREAIDKLYNNGEKAFEMGNKALNWFQEQFTASKMAEAYMKLYQDVLNSFFQN